MAECKHGSFRSSFGNNYCLDCGFAIWEHGGEKYTIPCIKEKEIKGEIRKIIVGTKADKIQFDEKFVIQTRVNSDLKFLVKGLESLPRESKVKERVEKITSLIKPFGLCVSRIAPEEKLEKNDPILIHRIDVDPFDLVMPEKLAPVIENISKEGKIQDPRWPAWDARITSMAVPFGQMLKPKQYDAISTVLKNPGSLTIAALPTGFGKTRIAQIITYLIRKSKQKSMESPTQWPSHDFDEGPTLIISPLVSLMDDQRNKWTKAFKVDNNLDSLNCRFLTSADLDRDSMKMEQLRNNELDVLCCSPEDLLDPKKGRNHWLETFARMKVPFSTMVVDEAHIIGSWGATIRPQFQLLPLVKNRLLHRNKNLRVLLMSATISIDEEEELIRLFGDGLYLTNRGQNRSSAIRMDDHKSNRPDLFYDVRYSEDQNEMITKMLEIRTKMTLEQKWNKKYPHNKFFRPGGEPSPLLIYTPYPDIAEKQLKQRARTILETTNVSTYTGNTSPNSRLSRLGKFLNNEIDAMIATSAFGMGVDKPDCWVVGYYGMPYSLSDLYQAFGRAARESNWDKDGYQKSGYCLGYINGNVRSFRSRMGVALTTERLWTMLSFEESYYTANGYLVLDISNKIDKMYWTTKTENVQIQNLTSKFENFDYESISEGQLNDLQQQMLIHARNQSDFSEEKQTKAYSKIKKEKELLGLRLWALACLQRSGSVDLMGFHPEVLYKDKGKNITLRDSLESGGYDKVIRNLEYQGEKSFTTPRLRNKHPQKRKVVIKIKKEIKDFDELRTVISTGIQILKDRHDLGKKELQQFVESVKSPKRGDCLRKMFIKTIGQTSSKTCVEQINENREKEKFEPIMPCSLCKNNQAFSGLFDEQELFVSTKEVLQALESGTVFKSNIEENNQFIGKSKKIGANMSNSQSLNGVYCLNDQNWNHGDYDLLNQNGRTIGKVVISNNKAEITTERKEIWDCTKIYFSKDGDYFTVKTQE